MIRSAFDKCFICILNDATKTNSHIIPAGLLKRSIGKRNKEEAYKIDGAEAEVESFFGRENLKNSIEEIKQDIHARDFYFCPSCESKLGELESKIIPFFSEKLRNDKYKSHFKEKVSTNGIQFLEFQNINKTDFLVFIYSVLWRLALLYGVEYNKHSLKLEEMEEFRILVFNYLYKDNEDVVNKILQKYRFILATPNEILDDSAEFAFTVDFQDNPNIFYVYEIVIFLHSVDDPAVATPFYECVNSNSQEPKVTLLPLALWNRLKQPYLKLLAEKFVENQLNKLSVTINKSTAESQFLLMQELSILESAKVSEDDYLKRCLIAIKNVEDKNK